VPHSLNFRTEKHEISHIFAGPFIIFCGAHLNPSRAVRRTGIEGLAALQPWVSLHAISPGWEAVSEAGHMAGVVRSLNDVISQKSHMHCTHFLSLAGQIILFALPFGKGLPTEAQRAASEPRECPGQPRSTLSLETWIAIRNRFLVSQARIMHRN
jgi:hypothetical protein